AGLDDLAARFPASLTIERVDIDQADAVHALRQRLAGRTIDVLFINAGIARAIAESPTTASEQDFLAMMLTNALAPVRAAELLGDLVPKGGT
ncbi:SDR family oxidoreductase, partial [Salmonella enterica]|uniref:SDR family oxidoreductase n=1 Tax=Salmonella enterica TaxID=28901 RepID=UPI003D280E85